MNNSSPPATMGGISPERKDLLLISGLVPERAKLLDIGCGEGELLALLKAQKQIDGRGLELSQSGVNACVARGLAVIQGDADSDLQHYPAHAFDYVILSQTLQTIRHPANVLSELARIGRKLIVSIPNFGHWQVRWHLLSQGRMPKTRLLDANWYDTPNIHLCTLSDFNQLCATLGLAIEGCITLTNGKAQHLQHAPSRWHNLFAEQAVFVLYKDESDG